MHNQSVSRDRFFEAAAKFTPLVAVDSLEARFIVSTGDEAVGRRLFRGRRRGEMVTLARTVEILEALGQVHWVRGTTFLDLGANIGTSAITALRSHDFARAVACEPEPENYRLLKVNAAMNDVDDLLTGLQVAVSDHCGTATLALDPINSGGHFVITGDREQETLTVEAVSVDYLIERGVLDSQAVGLIWIDAQGYEGQIIKGASSLTERGIPIVLEFHPLMLQRTGGRAMLEEIIPARYTHFIDLRGVEAGDPPTFELRPAEELSALAENLVGQESHFTDLLAVRLDPGANHAHRGT